MAFPLPPLPYRQVIFKSESHPGGWRNCQISTFEHAVHPLTQNRDGDQMKDFFRLWRPAMAVVDKYMKDLNAEPIWEQFGCTWSIIGVYVHDDDGWNDFAIVIKLENRMQVYLDHFGAVYGIIKAPDTGHLEGNVEARVDDDQILDDVEIIRPSTNIVNEQHHF